MREEDEGRRGGEKRRGEDEGRGGKGMKMRTQREKNMGFDIW